MYLKDTDFKADKVDLEVVLILQPLLERNGRNPCDVPVVGRERIRIAFTDEYGRPVTTERPRKKFTRLEKCFIFRLLQEGQNVKIKTYLCLEYSQ